jgi:hypothetical protein
MRIFCINDYNRDCPTRRDEWGSLCQDRVCASPQFQLQLVTQYANGADISFCVDGCPTISIYTSYLPDSPRDDRSYWVTEGCNCSNLSF